MSTMIVKAGPRGLASEIANQHRVGEMRVLSKEGDTRITWNARDRDEVEAAQAQFNDLVERGFTAYSVDPGDGSKAEQIREFDPQAQKIILAPQMAGGR